jgi:hypothetical protein
MARRMRRDVGARHVVEVGRPGHGHQAGIVRRQRLDQAQRIAVAIDVEQRQPIGLAGVAHCRLEGVAGRQQVILEGALQVAQGTDIGTGVAAHAALFMRLAA